MNEQQMKELGQAVAREMVNSTAAMETMKKVINNKTIES